MMASQPTLTSLDGSINRNPPERCLRPLYSRDSTQEHQEIPQEDQRNGLIVVKVEYEEDMSTMDDEPCKDEDVPPDISTDPVDTQRNAKAEEKEEEHVWIKEEDIPVEINPWGPSNKDTPERCPSSPNSWDSTKEDHEAEQEDQDENLIYIKVKEEAEETYVESDEPRKEQEIPPEIRTDGRYRRYNIEVMSPHVMADLGAQTSKNSLLQ